MMGEVFGPSFQVDEGAFVHADTGGAANCVRIEFEIQGILYKQGVQVVQGFGGAPDNFFIIARRIGAGGSLVFQDILDSARVLLQALLYVGEGQSLGVRAIVGHALNAPFAFLLDDGIAGPEPVPARFFEDGGSQRHLWKRATQGCFAQFERPAGLYLTARCGAITED